MHKSTKLEVAEKQLKVRKRLQRKVCQLLQQDLQKFIENVDLCLGE